MTPGSIEDVMQARQPGSSHPGSADAATFRFSTANWPERDRLTILREVIGRATMKLDFAPVSDDPFSADIMVQALPALTIVSGASANMSVAKDTRAARRFGRS